MNAPDKIYINTEAATDLRYNPGEDDSKIEYIRKNALLEWAKEIAENALWVSIDAVVNKIESL